MNRDRTSAQEAERICESIDPSGRLCLQPAQHTGRHRNGEHTWANDGNGIAERVRADSEVSAEPWVTVGFVAEPGDPLDTYRLSVTCQGVTHYMGVLIEGWEVAEGEARALAEVLGRDATVGPIWRNSQCDESGWKFPVARSVAWREKFFWADCTLDGLCGVVKECREIIQNTPDLSDSALNQLLELVLSKLNSGLLEVDREYTNADSPKVSGG